MKRSDISRNKDMHEYLTPIGLAKAMVNLIPKRAGKYGIPQYVLDPGANSYQGPFGWALHTLRPDCRTIGIELLEVEKSETTYYDLFYSGINFLTSIDLEGGWYKHLFKSGRWIDDIICNPPYAVNRKPTAELFVRQAMNCLQSGGTAVFLLRLNFLCSQERWHKNGITGLFKQIKPKKVLALPRRPSFFKEDPRMIEYFLQKKTNAHDYAVFVFEKDYSGKTELDWLDWDY